MDRITLFAEVLLPLPVPGTFTYRIPFELNEAVQIGQRVSVQFGSRKVYAGLILELHQKPPKTVPKYIISLLDERPVVYRNQIKFWSWIAEYYMSTLGEVMAVALPSAFKLSSESKVVLAPEFEPDVETLSESEFRITEALLEREKLTISEISDIVGFQKVHPLLKNMIERHLIYMEEELKETYSRKKEKKISLSEQYNSDDQLQILMDELGKRAHKQLEVLIAFISLAGFSKENRKTVRKDEIKKKVVNAASAISTLVEKGILLETEQVISRFEANEPQAEEKIMLSDAQQTAFSELNEKMEKHQVNLLHGVTSSGKTELYIKLIEDVLKEGKQVLYLLPEIALTTQIIQRLRKYFGDAVGVYHSRYNQNERAEVWENVAGIQQKGVHEPYKIILGPRSALFLPFDNLGLIIVDEEHDPSYKQYDPSPRYNARDAAIYLATLHEAKVVLGSATPALETYFNVQTGKYGLVTLKERYGGIQMPEIMVVNMKEEKRRRMSQSHFSSVLLNHLHQTLEEKHQAILFQNRRGFSLRIECDQCNWVPQCKYCDVTMTYHKKQDLLKCHYCGYSRPVPPICEQCESPNLVMKGFGTEKVEEELSMLIPEAKIERMDLDTTRSKNAFQKIFTDFEEGKTDILTGTQMVTKGLDFDKVQIVGILSADNMLSFPDFRSHERSFQLMEQVSGRAGRKNRQGKVIIQSWQPSHPIIRDVVDHDYHRMYVRELAERQKFRYPPYYRLVLVRLKHKKYEILNEAADVLAKDMRAQFGKRVYGPEYPMVSRVKNWYIKQILLKIPRDHHLNAEKQNLKQVIDRFKGLSKFKSVRVQLDVDPQ
ncbi:MAG: primosomal protein N' [Bacteroidales bacterium]|nr:primosomal protein N' [Bacteroidales bacterium]